jgi:hypothetical protein
VRYVPAVLRRGVALSLLAWTVAWPAAAAAPASSSVTVAFGVTVEGSQRTVVTSVRSSRDELGCSVTSSDSDRQTLTFASRREGRVVVAVPGRAASARLEVAIRASGTKRRARTLSGTPPECNVAPLTTERECGPVAIAGHTVVRLRAPGTVGLAGSLARRRDGARCAPGVAPARAFLTASEGQFPAALLTDRKAARIVLRGDARFTDTLASGARRVTTVRWTVILRRLS